ncbi:MAG: hypothetical protein HZC28_00250 [Spirochaetes bacterium]|nr:hypothetical protein [Spirochaetota bacterium]
MKRIITLILIFACSAIFMRGQNAPVVVEGGLRGLINIVPGSAVSGITPFAEVVFLPFAIPLQEGGYNRLGISAALGFPWINGSAGFMVFPLAEAHVVGRFGFVEKVPIDLSGGFGWRFTQATSQFYGTATVRAGYFFLEQLMGQAYFGYRFWPNPAYAADIYHNPAMLGSMQLGLALIWRFTGSK